MTNGVSRGLSQGREIKLKGPLTNTRHYFGLMIGTTFYYGPLLHFFLYMGHLKKNGVLVPTFPVLKNSFVQCTQCSQMNAFISYITFVSYFLVANLLAAKSQRRRSIHYASPNNSFPSRAG